MTDELSDTQLRKHLEYTTRCSRMIGGEVVRPKSGPYSVFCPLDGIVYLTREEAAKVVLESDANLSFEELQWTCPKCGKPAPFRSEHFERWFSTGTGFVTAEDEDAYRRR